MAGTRARCRRLERPRTLSGTSSVLVSRSASWPGELFSVYLRIWFSTGAGSLRSRSRSSMPRVADRKPEYSVSISGSLRSYDAVDGDTEHVHRRHVSVFVTRRGAGAARVLNTVLGSLTRTPAALRYGVCCT